MICAKRPFWMDKEPGNDGFSSVGVAIALLVTLSLLFSAAQVYRVQSASADTQEVADAAALAADNVIAEYYLVARLCDAVVLSLTLTGIVSMGMGIAALCTPLSAQVGMTLVNAAEKILKARDSFAKKAATGLGKLQKALPFLAAAAAYRVAAANNDGTGAHFVGFAMVSPAEGEDVSAGATGGADSLIDAVDDAAGTLVQAGSDAEEAAKKAKRAKERAYQADCGESPAYCMYERGSTLAGLSGEDNPYFSSADTWGFSVALNRAKAYYPVRLAMESPLGDSIDEQSNSALRKRFFAYAVDVVSGGYVHEGDDSFEADFPLLPKNTTELRSTRLFSEAVYPVSVNEEGSFEMHAWDGCPRAAGSVAFGSLADRESGEYVLCPACRFTASSLGKVASASSTIDNGFEYHYRIVAEEARAYEDARKSYAPKSRRVRRIAGSLFETATDSLREMASQRISVSPPGRLGVVAVVASVGASPSDGGFLSQFVQGGTLGTRIAVSGATLVSDTPEQGRTAIASALDGLRERGDFPLAGVLDGVMDVWSAVLFAYADGQSRIGEGIDELDSRLSLDSESRLGLWSSEEFAKSMESLGLQPVKLDSPKPVLVNTGHVLSADSGAFSARVLSVKRAASGLSGDNLLEGIVDWTQDQAVAAIEGFDGEVTIAEIEIAGEGSPSIPLTITIPDSLREDAKGLVASAAEWLRGIAGSIVGVRQWR